MATVIDTIKNVTQNKLPNATAYPTPTGNSPKVVGVLAPTVKPTYPTPTGQPLSVSTTTISNQNKINQVPAIQNKTAQLAQTGVTTDPKTGVATNADGSAAVSSTTPPAYDAVTGIITDYGKSLQEATKKTDTTSSTSSGKKTKEPETSNGGYVGDVYYPPGAPLPTDSKGKAMATTATSPTDDAILKNLNDQKSQSDAMTAGIIGSIQQQYEQLVSKQITANTQAQKSLTNALLMGGATGQGSSAQYAPISSQGILSSEINYGISKIGDLNNKEQMAIIEAQQAGQNADFELQDKMNQKISDIRDMKVKAAQDLNDKVAAANKVITDRAAQASKDTAIADLFSQGITDPAEILKTLNKNGGNFTAEEVADTLAKIATTTGHNSVDNLSQDVQEFYRLKEETGGLPVSILALPSTADQIAAYLKMKTNAETKASTKTSGTSGGSGSSGSSDIDLIAQAIINGNQPPVVTGLYGKTAAVRAELERQGFDYTKANQDFIATQKLLATLNGAQQTRLRQAINQVDESLPLLESLATEWDSKGLPALSAANLKAATSGALGQAAQSLAVRFQAEIADLTSELGTVYKGGNSSTDESLKLAATQLNANWSKKAFLDAVDLAKQNIQYRKNSLNLTTGGISDSQYNPNSASSDYTIKDKDTLYKLAQENGTTVEAIRQANPGIQENNLQIGQTIKLPSGTSVGGSGPDDFLNNPLPGAADYSADVWANS